MRHLRSRSAHLKLAEASFLNLPQRSQTQPGYPACTHTRATHSSAVEYQWNLNQPSLRPPTGLAPAVPLVSSVGLNAVLGPSARLARLIASSYVPLSVTRRESRTPFRATGCPPPAPLPGRQLPLASMARPGPSARQARRRARGGTGGGPTVSGEFQRIGGPAAARPHRPGLSV